MGMPPRRARCAPAVPSILSRLSPIRITAAATTSQRASGCSNWYNCIGCHANGGGGIGPPLIKQQWIYGGEPANIFDTIVKGRPNGMPAWGDRIPEYQIWQIVAYVRSMKRATANLRNSDRPDTIETNPQNTSKPDQAERRSEEVRCGEARLCCIALLTRWRFARRMQSVVNPVGPQSGKIAGLWWFFFWLLGSDLSCCDDRHTSDSHAPQPRLPPGAAGRYASNRRRRRRDEVGRVVTGATITTVIILLGSDRRERVHR